MRELKYLEWLRQKVKGILVVYDIKDLVVGGHCGCCGKWLPDEILPKENTWGLCDDCKETT